MALRLDQVRVLAERVAASHGLDVVDVEYAGGGGKHRTLRVFIEKNEAGRQRLREALERLEARAEDVPELVEPEAASATAGTNGAGAEESEWEREWLEALPSVANLEHLSGVTHEDCEVFSRDFGTVLDVEDLVPGSEYLLEVSSPGLDRRLTTARDFERFRGSLVKLETYGPIAVGAGDAEAAAGKGRKKWQGRIAGLEPGPTGEELLLTLEDGGKGKGGGAHAAKGAKAGKGKSGAPQASEHVAIPLRAIEKAHLVPEF